MSQFRIGDRAKIDSTVTVTGVDTSDDTCDIRHACGCTQWVRSGEIKRISDPLPVEVGSVVEATVLGENRIFILSVDGTSPPFWWSAENIGPRKQNCFAGSELKDVRVIYVAD